MPSCPSSGRGRVNQGLSSAACDKHQRDEHQKDETPFLGGRFGPAVNFAFKREKRAKMKQDKHHPSCVPTAGHDERLPSQGWNKKGFDVEQLDGEQGQEHVKEEFIDLTRRRFK